MFVALACPDGALASWSAPVLCRFGGEDRASCLLGRRSMREVLKR